MDMRRTSFGVGIGLATVFGAFIYSQSIAATSKEDAKAAIGEAAPDFTLKDIYGKEFKLSEFKNKIVVLEWMNQHCPVSRAHHDKHTMQDIYKKAADKVIWLGIDTGKTNQPESNRIYAAKMGIVYPILHDTDGKVGRSYGASHTPHLFVIDRTGKLAYSGAIDDKGSTNYVADAIEALLAGKEVAKTKTDPYGCGIKYP
jgi:peroxiredoxin